MKAYALPIALLVVVLLMGAGAYDQPAGVVVFIIGGAIQAKELMKRYQHG